MELVTRETLRQTRLTDMVNSFRKMESSTMDSGKPAACKGMVSYIMLIRQGIKGNFTTT